MMTDQQNFTSHYEPDSVQHKNLVYHMVVFGLFDDSIVAKTFGTRKKKMFSLLLIKWMRIHFKITLTEHSLAAF